MEFETLGNMIATLRKEKKLTQLELAQLMNVTDKAVSKWERDLAWPDIMSLSNLAKHLGVRVEDLINCKDKSNLSSTVKINQIIEIILMAVPMAMGIAVTVLSIIEEIEVYDAIKMLGIGLSCVGILLVSKKKKFL